MSEEFDDETANDRAWSVDDDALLDDAAGGVPTVQYPNRRDGYEGRTVDWEADRLSRVAVEDAPTALNGAAAETLERRAAEYRLKYSWEECSMNAILSSDSEDFSASLLVEICASILGRTPVDLLNAEGKFDADLTLATVRAERARLLQQTVDTHAQWETVTKNNSNALNNLQRTISMLSNEARVGREATEQLNEFFRFFAPRLAPAPMYVTHAVAYVEAAERMLEMLRTGHEAHKNVSVAIDRQIGEKA